MEIPSERKVIKPKTIQPKSGVKIKPAPHGATLIGTKYSPEPLKNVCSLSIRIQSLVD